MTYPDWPECLPRYAWLLAEGADPFGDLPLCKVCGERVNRSEREAHIAGHRQQLATARAEARSAALAAAWEARR